MNSITARQAPATPTRHAALSRPLVLLLASGAGLAVASIYYSQPMLGVLGGALGASARDTGFVPTLTQLGYALGILLLAPLGDRFDRRHLILLKTVLLAVALLASGLAPGLPALLVASLVGRPHGHAGAGHRARRRHAGARVKPRQDRRHGHDRAAAGHPAVARGQRLHRRALGLACRV